MSSCQGVLPRRSVDREASWATMNLLISVVLGAAVVVYATVAGNPRAAKVVAGENTLTTVVNTAPDGKTFTTVLRARGENGAFIVTPTTNGREYPSYQIQLPVVK